MRIQWFTIISIVILCSVSALTIYTQTTIIMDCINYAESTGQEYNKTINNLSKYIDNQDTFILYQAQQLKNLTEEYSILKEKYLNEKQAKASIKNEMEQINKKYDSLKSQKGLINPSYKELKRFINKDHTDDLHWTEEFDCSEFSYTFIKNFAKEGFYASGVELEFYKSDEEYGHIIVVVNTTDRGLIYVEPQDDITIKNIDIGDNYCDLVYWNCDWEIYKVSSCFELIV